MITTYNRPPYFDDFNVVDPVTNKTPFEKNYLRILFQPTNAVQNRELNQLQAILQSQINQFGDGIYKDGTPIIGGKTIFLDNIPYVDFTITNKDARNNFQNLKFIETRAQDSELIRLKAEILAIIPLTDEGGQNPVYRAWLRYTRGGEPNRFQKNNAIFLTNDIVPVPDLVDLPILDPAKTIGSVQSENDTTGFSLHVEEGVFFLKGCFVHTSDQTVYFIKEEKEKTITGDAIFNVIESITTSEIDQTLLDNANGTPNFAAPGADRYTIELKLGLLTSDQSLLDDNDENIYGDADSIDFNKLVEIRQSLVFTPARTEFSELNDVLAERTFEESGSYTVNPFLINIREFINENGNEGRFNLNQIDLNNPFSIKEIAAERGITVEEAAKEHMILEIDPSVAYVEGYRIKLDDKLPLLAEKSRETESFENIDISMSRGNYIDVAIDPDDSSVNFGGGSKLFDLRDSQKIRNIEFAGVISATEPEGTHVIDGYGGTRAGWLRYRLYVYNNFDPFAWDEDETRIYFRFLPETIVGGQPLRDVAIKNTNFKSSIFELPGPGIKTLDSIVYTVDRFFDDLSVDGDLKINISGRPFDSFGNITASNLIIYNKTTEKFVNSLVAVSFLLANPINRLDVTFNQNAGISTGDILQISCPVRVNDANTERRKTKTLENHIENFSVDPNTTKILTLEKQDVLIDKIVVKDFNLNQIITTFDVLDDGQNDSFYDSPALRIRVPPGTSNISIEYDYFEHSAEGDYFTVDSYPTSFYEKIANYKNLRLSDYIDFRVKREKTNGDFQILNPRSVARTFPSTISRVKYTQYLPRIDSLVVDNIGELYLVRGPASLNPEVPLTPTGTIKLYEINVPAYGFNINDVDYSYIDNKRYRMQDIGALEKRISNLEYYNSLSLLESEAEDKKILDLSADGDGIERFKNGILVDSFLGHNIGDPSNPDYLCAIDRVDQILRPYYIQKNFRLKYNKKVNGNLKNPGDYLPGELGEEALTLDEGEREVLFENLEASKTLSIQPYEVTTWEGQIKLSPSSDEWIDTERKPGRTIDLTGFGDAIEALTNQVGGRNGVLGTDWNSWQTNWQSTSSSRSTKVRSAGRDTPPFLRRETTTTTTTTAQQRRTGTQTRINFNPLEMDLGDRVVDLSIVPWIRSRDVYFRASGFKPNTKLFAFFDEEDVTNYVESVNEFKVFGVSDEIESYNNEPAQFLTDLFTDDFGEVVGRFRIPNNDELRFRTGLRNFKLTDNRVNNDLEADTFAEALYTASGLVQEKETTIISTRMPEITTRRVSQSRTVTNTSSKKSVRLFDPVAQTFYVRDNHPEGVFLDSIDLFFAQKPEDETIGAQIYLVSVENGIPTTNLIPGTKVFKSHGEINVSGRDPANPATLINDFKTKFTFDIPVYLKSGVEYAVVIFSISPEYRLWTSELGGVDIVTGRPITVNPDFGVLLKSQNKRTWTPYQKLNVTIKFNKIVFEASRTKTFQFSTKISQQENQDINDFIFSVINTSVEALNFPSTSLEFTIEFISDNGTTIKKIPILVNKENFELTAQIPRIAAPNAGVLVDQVLVTARMETQNRDLSPLIDVERCSLIAISNYIDNINDFDAESDGSIYDRATQTWSPLVTNGGKTTADGELTTSRYITRPVTLANPSEDLRVILAVNRPSEDCGIRVYAKRKPTDESEASIANDIGWYEMQIYAVNSNANAFEIPINAEKLNYAEVEYILPDPDPNFVDEAINENGFTEFVVKVVFSSADKAKIPTITDFRAIASM